MEGRGRGAHHLGQDGDLRGQVHRSVPTTVIIGKGGMGGRTAKACAEYGCVYGAFTGGAALLAARGIRGVRDVFWLEELGMPECLWVYEVEDFGPMIVTIDSHGNNMTENVKRRVAARKEEILESLEG